MRLRPLIVCLSLAALSAPAARGQGSGSGSATMTGTVLTAITISGSDLVFGSVLPTQSKRVTAAAGGRFVLSMAAATPVTIAYALPVALGPGVTLGSWELLSNTLNDPAAAQSIQVTSGNGSFTASTSTGTIYLWLGATVTTSNAGIGSYSRPITLTVTYN
jgi:hypothetical protein